MQEFITQQQWLLLPREVKNELINVFGIERTGISEVRDNEIISDGYSQKDLMVITKETMAKYIGSDESFLRAWEITLSKINFTLHPPVGEIVASKEVEGASEIVEAKKEEVITEPKETQDAITKKSK